MDKGEGLDIRLEASFLRVHFTRILGHAQNSNLIDSNSNSDSNSYVVILNNYDWWVGLGGMLVLVSGLDLDLWVLFGWVKVVVIKLAW